MDLRHVVTGLLAQLAELHERPELAEVRAEVPTLYFVPNLESVIQQVRDSQAWDFTTEAGLCAYTNACVVALHDVDPNFGHLTKTEAQNHCTDPQGRLGAKDVTLYRPYGQIVDFIQSAGYGVPPPPNNVCWIPGPEGEYPDPASWFAPVESGTGGGGGTDSGDDAAQLDRMEGTINETYAKVVQVELFLSNVNDQINLMATVVNQQYAENKMEGEQVRPGDTLTLIRKQ